MDGVGIHFLKLSFYCPHQDESTPSPHTSITESFALLMIPIRSCAWSPRLFLAFYAHRAMALGVHTIVSKIPRKDLNQVHYAYTPQVTWAVA